MKIMSQEKDSQRGQTSGKQQSAIHPHSLAHKQSLFCVCPLFPIFRSHLANIISQYNSIDTRICQGSEDILLNQRGTIDFLLFQIKFFLRFDTKTQTTTLVKNLRASFLRLYSSGRMKRGTLPKRNFRGVMSKKAGVERGGKVIRRSTIYFRPYNKNAQVNTCVLFWVGERTTRVLGVKLLYRFRQTAPTYWAASEQQKNCVYILVIYP